MLLLQVDPEFVPVVQEIFLTCFYFSRHVDAHPCVSSGRASVGFVVRCKSCVHYVLRVSCTVDEAPFEVFRIRRIQV